VYDAFVWLEGSGLGRLMRQSGPWTYAIVNLFHILGVSSLFGSVLILDLRLLGIGRRVPLGPLSAAVVPVAIIGLALAATTGVALFATKTTEYFGNPFLLIKFPAIGLALVNVLAIGRTKAWQARATRELSAPEERQLAMMGGVSLACWLTAVAAGRLIAYW